MRKSDLHLLCIWPLGLILCATLVHGQTTKKQPSVISRDATDTAAETARRLEQAKANGETEAARLAAAAAPLKLMEAVVAQAKESGPARPSFAEQEGEAQARKRLQQAMSRVGPEGKKILAQSGSTPSLRAPDDDAATTQGNSVAAATKASPLSASGPGPRPQPLKATPLTPIEKPPARTVIDARTSYFDSKAGFGVFVDDVVVDHPSFHLTSDELEVYMNKEESKGPEDAKNADGSPKVPAIPAGPTAGELALSNAAQATSGKGEPAPSERKDGGIRQAIAKGKRVLITKMSADGVLQTGIGREAQYEGATGDIFLRGWPQIQKDNTITEATEPTTYFIIKADGHFYAQGPARTRIIQEDQKKAPPPPPGASSITPPVPRAPAPGNKSQGGQP